MLEHLEIATGIRHTTAVAIEAGDSTVSRFIFVYTIPRPYLQTQLFARVISSFP
jgi:hypothetical protein